MGFLAINTSVYAVSKSTYNGITYCILLLEYKKALKTMKDTRLQIRVSQAEKQALIIQAEKKGNTVTNLVRAGVGLPPSEKLR